MFSKRTPDFIFDGELTEAGKRVIAYFNETLEGNTHNAEALNRLPGHVKSYFTYVVKLKTLTEAEFAKEFHGNAMTFAWDDLRYLEQLQESKAQTAETADKQSELEQQLEALKEELLGKVAEQDRKISALKGENTKLRNKLNENESESTDETDDHESEEDEPETDETADQSDESDEKDAD